MLLIRKISSLLNGLRSPMLLKNDFNDYNKYWLIRGFHNPTVYRAKEISKYIEPDSTILDIGCGDGGLLDFLMKNNRPKSVMGIDISDIAINYTRSRGYLAEKIDVANNKEFTEFLKGKSFDYVLLTEVIEHIIDPETVVSLLRPVIKKELMVTIPNSGFITHRLRLLFGKFPMVMIQCHAKEHLRYWTLSDFLYWADYCHFKVVKYVSCAGLHYKPLVFLEKMFPSIFSQQILFVLKPKKDT